MSPSPKAGGRPRPRFYGKYRGVVTDNSDPMQIGRVMAQVPDVLSESPSSWALPCVPAAGLQSGLYIVPPIGSQVWIEFERGDPSLPIWTGGFWGLAADVPVVALTPAATPPGQNIVLQTTGQNTLALSDAPPAGGIMLRAPGGAMIVVNETGVFISNGEGATITLTGSVVSINSDALMVAGATVMVDGAPLTPGSSQ
jgi:uncharacterized protein involved in type VI secretion and phage assembly